jgi:hypothetical protein
VFSGRLAWGASASRASPGVSWQRRNEDKEEKMALIAQEAHLPALDHHRRGGVGRELQATLLELIDLSLIGKQLHWNIFGRPFKPLHEQLDELVDSWRELSDTVAERAVALGVAPDGQAGAISQGSGISPSNRERSTPTPRCATSSSALRMSPSGLECAWTGLARSTSPRRTS